MSTPTPDLEVTARAPIALWRRGDAGPAVLLLHGYPDYATSLLTLAERLAADGFSALVAALPGFAPSGPVAGHAADDICGDLLLALDALGVRRAHVIGHDWGAALAYHLGCHHAERVDRLVAISVPHPAAFAARRVTVDDQRSLTYALLLADPAHGPALARDRRWVTALAAQWSPGIYRSDWPLVLDTVCEPPTSDQVHRYYHDDLRGAGRATGTVERRVTVIHGAQDGCIRPAVFCGHERFFAAGVRTHMLPAAGHWPHLEQAEAVYTLVAAALAD